MVGDSISVLHTVLRWRICPGTVTFLTLPQFASEPQGKGEYEKSIALQHNNFMEINLEGQESGGMSQKKGDGIHWRSWMESVGLQRQFNFHGSQGKLSWNPNTFF